MPGSSVLTGGEASFSEYGSLLSYVTDTGDVLDGWEVGSTHAVFVGDVSGSLVSIGELTKKPDSADFSGFSTFSSMPDPAPRDLTYYATGNREMPVPAHGTLSYRLDSDPDHRIAMGRSALGSDTQPADLSKFDLDVHLDGATQPAYDLHMIVAHNPSSPYNVTQTGKPLNITAENTFQLTAVASEITHVGDVCPGCSMQASGVFGSYSTLYYLGVAYEFQDSGANLDIVGAAILSAGSISPPPSSFTEMEGYTLVRHGGSLDRPLLVHSGGQALMYRSSTGGSETLTPEQYKINGDVVLPLPGETMGPMSVVFQDVPHPHESDQIRWVPDLVVGQYKSSAGPLPYMMAFADVPLTLPSDGGLLHYRFDTSGESHFGNSFDGKEQRLERFELALKPDTDFPQIRADAEVKLGTDTRYEVGGGWRQPVHESNVLRFNPDVTKHNDGSCVAGCSTVQMEVAAAFSQPGPGKAGVVYTLTDETLSAPLMGSAMLDPYFYSGTYPSLGEGYRLAHITTDGSLSLLTHEDNWAEFDPVSGGLRSYVTRDGDVLQFEGLKPSDPPQLQWPNFYGPPGNISIGLLSPQVGGAAALPYVVGAGWLPAVSTELSYKLDQHVSGVGAVMNQFDLDLKFDAGGINNQFKLDMELGHASMNYKAQSGWQGLNVGDGLLSLSVDNVTANEGSCAGCTFEAAGMLGNEGANAGMAYTLKDATDLIHGAVMLERTP